MENELDYSLEKASLKQKLLAIILLESSKPYKKMNSALITECVDFLMELEGKERLTKEEIERRVEEIPFAGKTAGSASNMKKKALAKKIILIAAVIAILISLFGIFTVSREDDEVGLINSIGNAILEMVGGETVESGNITLIMPDEVRYYDSIEELLEEQKIDVLCPTWLPDDSEIAYVMYSLADELETYRFSYNNNVGFGVSVDLNQSVPVDVKAGCQTKEINGYLCYYFADAGFAQASFEYKNNLYTVNADTEENVFGIVENLKEID